jgi:hypothetical protein
MNTYFLNLLSEPRKRRGKGEHDPWEIGKRSFLLSIDGFPRALSQSKGRREVGLGFYLLGINAIRASSLTIELSEFPIGKRKTKFKLVINDQEDILVIKHLLLKYNFNINFIQRHCVWLQSIIQSL